MSYPGPHPDARAEDTTPPFPPGGRRFVRSARMGEQPVGRLLLSFSLPALVGMGVTATYNIVATAFFQAIGRALPAMFRRLGIPLLAPRPPA